MSSAEPSVVTLTPAPAFDRTYALATLAPGRVNRARRVSVRLAGKGVNLARNLHLTGVAARAVVPWPARTTVQEDWLVPVVTRGATRVNVVLTRDDGTTTNINEVPEPLSVRDWEAMCAATIEQVGELKADWLVIGGQIPLQEDRRAPDPGALFDAARGLGAGIVLDSIGETVDSWLAAGHAPDLIKPNVHELSELTGMRVVTLRDAERAAHKLLDRGIRAVFATLGADGGLLVTPEEAAWAPAEPVRVRDTTGAGDAALAGYLCAAVPDSEPATRREALAQGIAWGSRAVQGLAVRSGGVRTRADVLSERNGSRRLADGVERKPEMTKHRTERVG